jgi:hypothetical protein
MSGETRTLGETVAYVCAPDGPPLDGERAATDVLGEASGSGARLVVVPIERLGPGFLTLSTRVAGEVIQKFVNYGFRLAFVGDVSEAVAASGALRDFISESNRGRHVWFVPDMAALEERLAS